MRLRPRIDHRYFKFFRRGSKLTLALYFILLGTGYERCSKMKQTEKKRRIGEDQNYFSFLKL